MILVGLLTIGGIGGIIQKLKHGVRAEQEEEEKKLEAFSTSCKFNSTSTHNLAHNPGVRIFSITLDTSNPGSPNNFLLC